MTATDLRQNVSRHGRFGLLRPKAERFAWMDQDPDLAREPRPEAPLSMWFDEAAEA